MKKTDEYEIFSVRFNKLITEKDIHFTTYTLGVPAPISFIIPISIILKENKITVEFDNQTQHVFFYESGVELFIRKIDKNVRNISTKDNQGTT